MELPKHRDVPGQLWTRAAEQKPALTGRVRFIAWRLRCRSRDRGPRVATELVNPHRVKPFSSGVFRAGRRVA